MSTGRTIPLPQAEVESQLEQLSVQVRAARKALGLTQQELADRLGLSRSQVANVEAARTDTSAARLLPLLVEAGVIVPSGIQERGDRAVRWNRENAAVAVLHRALDEASEGLAELERARGGGP